MKINLIGVDCATQQNNIGVALGSLEHDRVVITSVKGCSKNSRAVDTIMRWIDWQTTTLIALDAPLGWPRSLRTALTNHKAGEPLHAKADDMFSRKTDKVVQAKIKQKPLEVGANFIARTAYAALDLIADIRHELQQKHPGQHEYAPLAWSVPLSSNVSVIEVYPAATLRASDWHKNDLRRKQGKQSSPTNRVSFLRWQGVMLPDDIDEHANEHAIDAAICVLAAADFLQGKAIGPTDEEFAIALDEGWIWVRQKADGVLDRCS